MTIPSPSRLAKWLEPYAGAKGVPIRVWGLEAEPKDAAAPSMEAQLYGPAPKLVCLGGCEHGLVVVRQTRDSLEDMDGVLVPWEHVVRLERDPHLVRDVVLVELRGRGAMPIAVSNHVLLPGNRTSAKLLCDLARRHSATEGHGGLDTRTPPPPPPSCNLPPRTAPGLA